MVKNDLLAAQQIISGSRTNVLFHKQPYHKSSFIYRKSNEKISMYQDYLKHRSCVASVIASGNQILNSIYEGTLDITAFDVSVFPRYYLELQLALLMSFSREEFCKFLYDDTVEDEVFDDMFFEARQYLTLDSKIFWEGLFQFFDWSDIRQSTLFSSDAVFLDEVKKQNYYLQSDENFNQLKESMKNVSLDFYTGDVSEIMLSLPKKYDFINFSSIIYYKKLDEYYRMLSQVPLLPEGQALTYLYEITPSVVSVLQQEGCTFSKFSDEKEGVMIYTKKK